MNKNLFKNTQIRLILICLLSFNTLSFANREEFPNYFRDVPKQRVEEALFAILRGLQIPHVDGNNPDGTPKIVNDGFFSKLEKKVKDQDPDAKVYIAGGVVRSLLGYIYKKMYNGMHRTPLEEPAVILDRIISQQNRKGTKKEILSLSALGVGSDLDILIEPSDKGQTPKEEIKRTVTDFINSAEKQAGLEHVKTKFKYAVVPIGDVKDYHDQIKRTTAQGGSALDLLIFLPERMIIYQLQIQTN
jgi:hypothetical protein